MNVTNLKVGTRLYGSFGIVIALIAAMLLVSQTNFSRMSGANKMNVHTYQVLGEIDGLLTALVNIETGERGFALTGKDASLEPLNAGKDEFRKHLDSAKSLTSDNPAQQRRLDQLAELQRQWLDTAITPVIDLRRGTASDHMVPVVEAEQAGKGKKAMDAMRVLLADISGEEMSLLKQRSDEAAKSESSAALMLWGGGLLTAVFALIVALLITRSITRPLSQAIGVARKVADGDLSSEIAVSSRDEIGQLQQALRDMNDKLADIVRNVRNGTDTMATASSEIAAGNLDLSSRTEQQASSLEETASSMEELTSTVRQNAENAGQANQLAISASEVAARGGSVVSEVVETMEQINGSARKIVDIIGVIDGIAFQTNILALNAAVEAARAGEQGRGFAVVATEVRSLAQRSAAAAKEIKSLIGDSVDKVENGSRLVAEAGSTMDEVVASVRRVTDIMAEITAASHEQSTGIEQVNQAITQMDQVTQQNAALVEEAAAAADSLQEQAAALSEVVSVFRVSGTAGSAAAKPRSTARKPAKVISLPASTRRTEPAATATAPKAVTLRKTGTGGAADEWEEF